MGEQSTSERVVMKLKDLTEEKLDRFCSSLVKRNEAIIRDMEELAADLGFDYDEADVLGLLPFFAAAGKALLAVASKAAVLIKTAVGLAGKAIAAAKVAATAKAAFASKSAFATKALKAWKFAKEAAAAATRAGKRYLAGKLNKAAAQAKKAADAAKAAARRAGKHMGKAISNSKRLQAAKKICNPRTGRGPKLNKFIEKTKTALKKNLKEFKHEVKRQVYNEIDNWVAEHYPELHPYMGDIRDAIKAIALDKGKGGMTRFMKDKVKEIAERKVDEEVNKFVVNNWPQLTPYLDEIKGMLKVATKNPSKTELIEQTKQACRKIATIQVKDWMYDYVRVNVPHLRNYMTALNNALKAASKARNPGKWVPFLMKKVKAKMDDLLRRKFRTSLSILGLA